MMDIVEKTFNPYFLFITIDISFYKPVYILLSFVQSTENFGIKFTLAGNIVILYNMIKLISTNAY